MLVIWSRLIELSTFSIDSTWKLLSCHRILPSNRFQVLFISIILASLTFSSSWMENILTSFHSWKILIGLSILSFQIHMQNTRKLAHKYSTKVEQCWIWSYQMKNRKLEAYTKSNRKWLKHTIVKIWWDVSQLFGMRS